MVAPNLGLTVEPSEDGTVHYLRLAPRERGTAPNRQLSLTTKIRNNEPAAVRVMRWVISFPDAPALGSTTLPRAIDIQPGDQATAFFFQADNILLPVPGPDRIRIDIFCNDFADPSSTMMNLQFHTSPVPGGSYAFPARKFDLNRREYWQGRSAAHASGFGSQLFAYDLSVVRFDHERNEWTGIRAGTDGTENEHSLTYGKPIYAMADGIVVAARNDMLENERPGVDPPPGWPVEGDHFWIQHGSEVVVYAHLQPASMNPALMYVGAVVRKGDVLGAAGNSGSSSGPHLHIHAMRGNAPWGGPFRPLPFCEAQSLDRSRINTFSGDGRWFNLDGDGLPNVDTLIWPEGAASALIIIRGIFQTITAFIRLIARLVRFPLGPDPVPNRK